LAHASAGLLSHPLILVNRVFVVLDRLEESSTWG